MNNFDKHKFDEIFKVGLTAPDLSEVDEDWTLMKARLQNGKSRNLITYYMILVSSVAAVFLLAFSIIFNFNGSTPDQGSSTAKNKEKGIPEIQASNSGNNIGSSIPENTALAASGVAEKGSDLIYYSNFTPENELNTPVQVTGKTELENNDVAYPPDTSNSVVLTALTEPQVGGSSALIANVDASEKLVSLDDDINLSENEDTANLKTNSSKSRFSLAINFAPDLNGVEHFQASKVSYSVGAGLIYNISKKLSIEAGAAYGKKNYQTGFSSFRPLSYNLFPVKANIVSSGFDIMDIQLNFAYTILNRGRSSIGFGAGVSSYLMLDEQYSFTYQNTNARGLTSFRTGYQNNHFFGIANLNLSYKRSLTNNVKLAFNPYLKLPLTDLGYGNIRLRSAGMSVGVISNLNKSKK